MEALEKKFVESGEEQRLKELLRRRLEECGWHDEIRKNLRDTVKERGIESVTVEDLIKDITPKARQSVPENVKRELLNQIRSFMQQQTNMDLGDI